MKQKIRNLRIKSFILALAMLFSSSIFVATAQQADVIQTEESPISATQSGGKFLNEISFEGTGEYIPAVYELNDRREENVKHFSMPDGTYRAVVYGEAVHRKDADGKWTDIDNSLTLTVKNGMNLYSDADGRISFASSAQSSEQGSFLFSLTENEYLLAMALIGNTDKPGSLSLGNITATASVATVTNPATKEALTPDDSAELQFEKLSAVDNQTEIVYADVLSGIDLEYTLRSNSIKENIVVKSEKESYVYRFEIVVKGLTAALSDDGSITLSDSETNAAVYYIPAPYMTDADGNVSHDVSYSLTELSEDSYELIVTASAEWINAKGRAFPVKIDPTVTMGAATDTYIDQEHPNDSFGGEDYLLVGSDKIAFVKLLQLPTLPVGSYIDSAYLDVYYYFENQSQYETTIVGAYQITQFNNFSANITWNYAHSTGNMVLTDPTNSWVAFSNSSTTSETSPKFTSFDVSDIVQNWYSGMPNYGIAIKNYSTINIPSKIKSWNSGSTYMPRYRITYTAGIEDGVYGLKNLGTDEWITHSSGDFILESDIINPASSYKQESLFKISNIAGTNRYVIRSMRDNGLTLGCSFLGISPKKIPYIDSEVPFEDTFYIANSESGVRIIPVSMPEYIITAGDYTPDIAFYEGAGATEYWSLHRYHGFAQYGASIGNAGRAYVGTVNDIPLSVWSTDTGMNIPSIAISQDSQDKAFGTFDSTNHTISLIPHYDGEIFIDITISNISSTTYSTTLSVNAILLIENGIYHIKNKHSDKFITSQTQLNGNQIILSSFDNDDYRKQYWYFEHSYDGYYLIRSIWSDYYISVPSDQLTSTTAGFVQDPLEENWIDQQRQLWRISAQTNGCFTIQAKSSATNSGNWLVKSNTNGDVIQAPYDTNNSFLYNWHLIKKESLSMVNFYDSTIAADPELVDLIDEANQFVTDVIWYLYGVEVKMDGDATLYTGEGPDSCDKPIDEACSNGACSEDCNSHHKNTHFISDQIYENYQENNHIYVLWCNREPNTYCTEIDGIHTTVDSNVYGRVHDQRPVIHIMKIPESYDYDEIKAYMAIILLHEFAHTLKIGEPYNDSTHTNYGCVMCRLGDTTKNIYTSWITDKDPVFCSDCESAIYNNIYSEIFERN